MSNLHHRRTINVGVGAWVAIAGATGLLAGAGGPSAAFAPHSATSLAAPPGSIAGVGRYTMGPPYEQAGVWFVPAAQPDYDQVGRPVLDEPVNNPAAGENDDVGAVAASHPTLPLPSIVEVTNLATGRTLSLRVEARGVGRQNGVIGLSHAAAEQLGLPSKHARVRVRYIGPAELDEQTARSEPAGPAQPGRLFSVQVGAFADQSRAKRVAARLAVSGDSTIHPTVGRPQQLYRVVVGSWGDRNTAEGARSRIAALGFPEARVVDAL